MQILKSWLFTTRAFNMSKKINYPSANRNKGPILEVLQKHFNGNIDGKVLEISSGTGQHVGFFAQYFSKLTFQPSEVEVSLLESILAYSEEVPTKNVKEPIYINITDDWTKWKVPNDFDYAININMIHVAPYSCSVGLFKNISKVLKQGGLLITYGPYANNGVLEPQSNIDFDRNVRARDPSCGVRDIQDLKKLAEHNGIKLDHIYDLPSNNKCLVWRKV